MKVKRKQKDPAGSRVDRIFLPTLKAAEGARSFTFTLSTPAVDREGDSVQVEGIDLTNYKRNPIVLYGHNYWGLPIGKATAIGVVGRELKATAEFIARETYELAGQVFEMLRDGYLSAVSIGFLAHKTAYDELRHGWDVIESELLEFSVVPVPMHPDALISRSATPHVATTRKWALEAMHQLEPGGLWLSHDQVVKLALGKAAEEPPEPEPDGDPTPEPTPADAPATPPPAATADAALPAAAAPAQELVVLNLAPEEQLFHVTPDDVVAATRAAVSDLANAEIRRLTGRLSD